MLTLVHDGPLPSNEVAPEVAGPLRAAVWYLRHEWSRLPLRRISVAELAIAAHVSRGYLNRLFQATFGSTASAALEHLRCSRAEALITRTDLTIAAIARQCGYTDVAHFSHRFKRYPRHLAVRLPRPGEPVVLGARRARGPANEPACVGSVISRAGNRQTSPRR
jgi:AraC-like DNA-binding protein